MIRSASKNICSVRHRPILCAEFAGHTGSAGFRHWSAPSSGANHLPSPSALQTPRTGAAELGNFAFINLAHTAINGDQIAISKFMAADKHSPGGGSIRIPCPGHTGPAHALGHQPHGWSPPRAVRIPAAACMPWMSSGWFPPAPESPPSFRGSGFSFISGQRDCARRRPGRGRQAAGKTDPLCIRVKSGEAADQENPD